MAIFFPPCTYLTYAGMANWYDKGRAEKRIEAASFFMQCYNAPIQHICVENPQGIMDKIFRKHDQEIHPYYFGEPQMKRTHLWLKNLPLLQYRLQTDLFETKTASVKPLPKKGRYFTDSTNRTSQERSIFF